MDAAAAQWRHEGLARHRR